VAEYLRVFRHVGFVHLRSMGPPAMKLLRKLACLLIGHAPIVERRGDDSVFACERCHRLFHLFVKGVYAVK
jgi:hypothetical protein